MILGYTPSKLDGTEHVFTPSINSPLPEEYTYRGTISPVDDQGSKPWCLPYSLTSILNTEMNMRNNTAGLDYGFSERDIYRWRENKKVDGMMPKTALHHLRHDGLDSEIGRKLYIDQYFLIRPSEKSIKEAILLNGPVLIALRVKDSTRDDFWNGDGDEGGHAIVLVGYNKDGFILRNSWGKSYGDGGYILFPKDKVKDILEAWTVTYRI